MKPTQQLHELGQSLWLDNITRTILDDGTLARYIDDLSVTGLTSNPTIFDKAISEGEAYDEQIAELGQRGLEGEELFFELALADLRRAAKLFEPANERTDGVDGWVSLEVSPLLAFADHGEVGEPRSADGGDAEQVLAEFAASGIDVDALATRLQHEGADAFVASWKDLLGSIASEREKLLASG